MVQGGGANLLIMLFGQQQYSTHVGLVVVQGVQLGWGDVEGSLLREAIVQSLVLRQQVHIVHGDVVGVIATLQEANVDQGGPVKPTLENDGCDKVANILGRVSK